MPLGRSGYGQDQFTNTPAPVAGLIYDSAFPHIPLSSLPCGRGVYYLVGLPAHVPACLDSKPARRSGTHLRPLVARMNTSGFTRLSSVQRRTQPLAGTSHTLRRVPVSIPGFLAIWNEPSPRADFGGMVKSRCTQGLGPLRVLTSPPWYRTLLCHFPGLPLTVGSITHQPSFRCRAIPAPRVLQILSVWDALAVSLREAPGVAFITLHWVSSMALDNLTHF